MNRSHLGSYSRSGALSTEHYRLVQAVEEAQSVEEVTGALLGCLSRIKRSWEKKAPSPSKARHDLVLLLYCREQRLLGSVLTVEDQALFAAEWALPTAVMLAGGGGGGLKERAMGYRACAELFSPAPHPLKLLLINTIRSDLHAQPDSPHAEGRHALALRAIASPVLASPELLPAVRERVFELLNGHGISEPTRRLALAALLSLVRVARSPSSLDDPCTLTQEARQTVLSLLLPPPPSATSASSSGKRHRSSRRRHAPTLPFLADLASALSSYSPLFPILPDAADRVALLLGVLRQVLDLATEEGPQSRSKGFWALSRVLEVISDALRPMVEYKELSKETEEQVEKALWQAVEGALAVEGELSDAVTLSALRLLPSLPSSSSSTSLSVPPLLLTRLHTSLLRLTSPTAHLFALRALALLPPSSWATPASPESASGEGKGKARASDDDDNAAKDERPEWGEPAWRAILAGLDDPDPAIRKATLALLMRVDAGLVKLHYQRLLQSLSPTTAATAGSTVSVSSTGSTMTGRRKTRARVVPLLLETLPFLETSSAPRLPISPSTLRSLVETPELALSPTDVLPQIVLPVLESFRHALGGEQYLFAQELFTGGAWRESVILGLVVAGTVHVLAGGGDGEDQRAMVEFGRWMANPDGSTSPDLLTLLQEPLLFALLRLLTLSPTLAPSTLTSLSASLSLAASRSADDPSTTPLFHLALGLTAPDGSGAASVRALNGLARETREKSLAEFGEALLAAVEAAEGESDQSTPAAASIAHDFADQPAPSAYTSRLHHPRPPPVSGADQPLRYAAYPTSSSTSTPSSAAALSSSSPFTSLPYPTPRSPVSPPSASTSAAARARERADLLRERDDRGGRGGGAAASLMGAGELALRAEGMALSPGGSEVSEEEGEGEGGGEGKGEEGAGNALGLETGEGAQAEGRSREVSGESEAGSAAGAGGGSGEPPANLLLSLATDEDPFHNPH